MFAYAVIGGSMVALSLISFVAAAMMG